MLWSARLIALVAAALLAACASTPKPPPEPLPSLAAEQRYLTELFRGTPVQVVADDDGGLWVEVPQVHCFEPGQAAPKPALVAVLDKVANSLRRQPQTRVRVVVPAEGGGALSNDRAAKVRDHLYTRGVLTQRITVGAPTTRAEVRLLMQLAPPAAASAATPPTSR
jgi:outer membrane protein OmpA-like peptidoglycan-associated protein